MNMWEKVRKLKSNQSKQPTTLGTLKHPQKPDPNAHQEDLLSTFHPSQSGNNQPQKQLIPHQRHSSNPIQPNHSQEQAPVITLNGHMPQQNLQPTAHLQLKQTSNPQNTLSTHQFELSQGRNLLPHRPAPNIQSLNKSAVTFDWLTTSTFADLAATNHQATETPAEDIVEMSVIESEKEENEVIDLDELVQHNATKLLPVQKPPASASKGSSKLGNDSSKGQSSVLDRKARKLKLRDYIYMVESTSRHSLSKGKTSLNSSESLTLQKKQAKQQQANYSLAKTTRQGTVTRRKEQAGSKYSVPSAEMVEIIKKEVKADIARVSEQLGRINAQMQEVQAESEQQSIDRQLLCLYQVRRQVKQEISKRIEATLALLISDKSTSNEGKSWTGKQSSSLLSNRQ